MPGCDYMLLERIVFKARLHNAYMKNIG